MTQLIAVFAIAILAGCGIETATTAASGAAIKKQEIEQGQKTQEQMRQKVEQATRQMEQRAEKGGEN